MLTEADLNRLAALRWRDPADEAPPEGRPLLCRVTVDGPAGRRETFLVCRAWPSTADPGRLVPELALADGTALTVHAWRPIVD